MGSGAKALADAVLNRSDRLVATTKLNGSGYGVVALEIGRVIDPLDSYFSGMQA